MAVNEYTKLTTGKTKAARALARKVFPAERKYRVADLYLKNVPCGLIAEKLKVTPATVSKDLKELREEWQESALLDFNARMGQELAKLDKVEVEAWEGWRMSIRDATIHRKIVEKALRVIKDEEGKKAIEKSEAKTEKQKKAEMVVIKELTNSEVRGQSGNPAYLQQIERCILARCQLLGLMKADANQSLHTKPSLPWDDIIAQGRLIEVQNALPAAKGG